MQLEGKTAIITGAGGGSIVNIASIAALIAANSADYAASKAGVLSLTRVAALEYIISVEGTSRSPIGG